MNYASRTESGFFGYLLILVIFTSVVGTALV